MPPNKVGLHNKHTCIAGIEHCNNTCRLTTGTRSRMSRQHIIACLLAGTLVWGSTPAKAFFFSRGSVRNTLQRMVEAIENENIQALKTCISPRFLVGNPEIPGRIEDAFDKFDGTRISYKIASIREADGIAAVKLNWTKTTTNPMNNWTYRDIGTDVVMYFNAESPYQLVGLEDGSLFGISFLLTTRIVIPAPDEKRLELARKELELTERQAALAREQAEREAARAAAKQKEKELLEARKQARIEAEQREREEREAQEQAAREEQQKAEEARKAEEQAAAREAESKEKKPDPPMPGSDLTAEEMARLLALEATIKDAIGTIPGQAPALSSPADPSMGQTIRDKAEEEARRMLRATPGTTHLPPPAPDKPAPAISPELENWRQERLREIRAAQNAAIPLYSQIAADGSPESIQTLREIEESARIHAELKEKTNLQAIQMLAEQRARDLAKPDDIAQDQPSTSAPAAMAASREHEMLLAKEEAEARAKAVIEEIARLQQEEQAQPEKAQTDKDNAIRAAREQARRRAEQEQAELREIQAPQPQPTVAAPASLDQATLQQIEEEAQLQAAIKAKAESDAKALAVQRQLETLTNVSSETMARLARETTPRPESDTPTSATTEHTKIHEPTPDQLAAAIRQKAETDAELLRGTDIAPTPSSTHHQITEPTPQTPAPASTTDIPTPVQPTEPALIAKQPVPAATQPTSALPEPVAETTKTGLDLVMISGGRQSGGPLHDFQLAKYEVTNDEFVEFLNNAKDNPYNGRGSSMFFDDDGNVYMDDSTDPAKRLFAMTELDFGGTQHGIIFESGKYHSAPELSRHPVVGVSWFGALKYCNWLTIHSGLGEDACAYTEGSDPEKWHPSNLTDEEWHNGFSDIERQNWLDANTGYRLPMNSYNTTTGRFNEFYAAAAWDGTGYRSFAFGRDTLTAQDANYADADTPFKTGTTPVGYFDGSDHNGTFATNPNQNRYGIHDLSGNVWEWSNDTTGNPDYRALFGGSFDGDEDTLKTTFRGSLNPYRACDNVGFRIAITPKKGGQQPLPQPVQ